MLRKVSVCASIEYQYIVELDDDFDVTNTDNLCFKAEAEDPYFHDLAKVLSAYGAKGYADTVSIVDDDTGEILY